MGILWVIDSSSWWHLFYACVITCWSIFVGWDHLIIMICISFGIFSFDWNLGNCHKPKKKKDCHLASGESCNFMLLSKISCFRLSLILSTYYVFSFFNTTVMLDNTHVLVFSLDMSLAQVNLFSQSRDGSIHLFHFSSRFGYADVYFIFLW
jgi:hypothetical protein